MPSSNVAVSSIIDADTLAMLKRWQGKTHTSQDTITLAPVSLSATAALGPATKGARLSFHATVEVRIPLVGGKLENFIGSQLVKLLTAEQRFTTTWIADSAG